jgi:HNH endonuclease
MGVRHCLAAVASGGAASAGSRNGDAADLDSLQIESEPVFSEATKLSVRRKGHLRCCLCHDIGVEIHHIVPQAEGGSDDEDNAAPLCPTCHEKYGANPTKRKFIREARDLWYEICEQRFADDPSRLDDIRRALENVATKEDLELLLVTVAQGRELEGHMISLANEVFTELETARYQLEEAKSRRRGWRSLDMLPGAKFDKWQLDPVAVRDTEMMKAFRGVYVWMHRKNMEMQRREISENVDKGQLPGAGLALTQGDLESLEEGLSRIRNAQDHLQRLISELASEPRSIRD